MKLDRLSQAFLIAITSVKLSQQAVFVSSGMIWDNS